MLDFLYLLQASLKDNFSSFIPQILLFLPVL